MNLFEYIKSQLPQMPNVAIMKQLGASDELVEYVKETTWNTNLGMMETLGCGDEPTPGGEVWYTGTAIPNPESPQMQLVTLTPTTLAKTDMLYETPTNYDVSLNGETLLFALKLESEHGASWADNLTSPTIMFQFGNFEGDSTFYGAYVPSIWKGEVNITVAHK